jgi:hypothetical protein
MPEINQLAAADTVNDGDLVPIYSQDNGDARAAPMSVLLNYFQSLLTGTGFISQYLAPSASFSIAVAPVGTGTNIHLVLTPTLPLAAGTITLPALADCVHGQEVIITSTEPVTALTVASSGATVNGAPATLTANGFCRLRFDAPTASWYRIG